MTEEVKPCEGQFNTYSLQAQCVLCKKPLIVHLQTVLATTDDETNRVIKTPIVPDGEYLPLRGDQTIDGKSRVLVPMETTKEEIAFIWEELLESDRVLESIAKVTDFFEGSESPAEALAEAETEDPAELEGLATADDEWEGYNRVQGAEDHTS